MTFDKEALRALIKEVVREEMEGTKQMDLPIAEPKTEHKSEPVQEKEPEVESESEETQASPKVGRPRGRPPGRTSKPEVTPTTSVSSGRNILETTPIGENEARLALKKFSDLKGVAEAKTLLKTKFSANRFSEVKPEDYGRMMAECSQ